jgi:tryptophan halogenase
VPEPIRKIVVVGGGSAGFMAALTLVKRLPAVKVEVVHSPDIPVIGVGESTTVAIPRFLHEELQIDRQEFFRAVEPSWKLGLRLEFGVPEISHFNYPFDLQIQRLVPGSDTTVGFHMLADAADASLFGALMDRCKSPCRVQNGRLMSDSRSAYHIKNDCYIAYLQRKSIEAGASTIEGEVESVARHETGDVASLTLKDGRTVTGDFFVDCSGFRSLLLGKTLGTKFLSYAKSLLCDTAIVGQWNRSDDEIRPYTTCTTMNHGWCWRIDFHDLVTRGYVHSSAFCSIDEAMREMKEKNPQLGDDLRVLKFPSGRYENFWVGNVAGIGNASGFVEPLEATALHMIVEQSHFLSLALADGGMRVVPAIRQVENARIGRLWDDIRNFLALHYRFNRKLDTPFWRHCQETVDLAGAAPLVEYYQAAGPSALISGLLDPVSMFNVHGYLLLLLGQQVPTVAGSPTSPQQVAAWRGLRDLFRKEAEASLPMRTALEQMIFGNG